MKAADAQQGQATPAADAELVARAAGGDAAALAALYDRHAGHAFALALRLLGARKEAEDVVQDVFLEIWREAARFDPTRGPVIAWILVKTRSRTLDHLRRASVRRAGETDEPELRRMMQRIADVPERRIAIRQGLDALPDEVRDVLVHTFFFGSTGIETGRALGVPEGTVRSRLARGLAMLGELLREDDES